MNEVSSPGSIPGDDKLCHCNMDVARPSLPLEEKEKPWM